MSGDIAPMAELVSDARSEALEREVCALLRRLIGCDTSNPPGDETQAAAILEDHLADAGLACERIAKDESRANLLVRLPGAGTGPSLAFLGHLDVVPARRADWSVEPFAAIERDGVIWGRGAVDMKCQVAATAVALATLAREGFQPNGDLMLVLMADEELGDAGVGSTYFVEARPPEAGVDALTEARRLLARLDPHRSPTRIPTEIEPVLDALGDPGATREEQLAAARAAHPGLDRVLGALVGTVMHATMLEAPGPVNVIADRVTATIECIVLPSTTVEELEAELRVALRPGRYELDVVAPHGGLVSSADTPLRDAIEDFLAEHDPDARLLPALGYGFSDCDVMREAYGSVAYGFIPFRHAGPMTNLDTKHGADERIATKDLLFQTRAAIAVARAIGALSRPDASVGD